MINKESIDYKNELEKKLKIIQKNLKNEKIVEVKGFSAYMISSEGYILAKERHVEKPAPRCKEKTIKYTIPTKILKPLSCGRDGKWLQYKIVNDDGTQKQHSLSKLLLASFLDIDIDDLPKYVYVKDKKDTPKLNNLSFFTDKNRQ